MSYRTHRDIEARTAAITDLFRDTEKLLAGVGKQQGDESDSELKVGACMDWPQRPCCPSDVKQTDDNLRPPQKQVRRNLQRSLAGRIQKLSHTFRGQQKEYLNKLRAQKEGALGQVSWFCCVLGWLALLGWVRPLGRRFPFVGTCVACHAPRTSTPINQIDRIAQEQFAFLNKADAEVITIKDAASDTGFTQAQVAVVDNMDAIVNERSVRPWITLPQQAYECGWMSACAGLVVVSS